MLDQRDQRGGLVQRGDVGMLARSGGRANAWPARVGGPDAASGGDMQRRRCGGSITVPAVARRPTTLLLFHLICVRGWLRCCVPRLVCGGAVGSSRLANSCRAAAAVVK